MKFKILGIILLGMVFKANATGIDSEELKITCYGQIEMTKIKKIGVFPGFTDRAGNYHSPYGYAYIESSISSLTEGCSGYKEKLGIHLEKKNFEHYFSFASTDKEEIEEFAKEKIGNLHDFEVVQSFGYKEKSGYLPFFPLIHSEKIDLVSKTISIADSFAVDVKKVYGINLWEDSKLELEVLIFEYLKKNTGTISKTSLLEAMLDNHPKFKDNFKNFTMKLLGQYAFFEKIYDAGKFMGNEEVITIASHIRELSYKYPEKYAFDLPNMLANHPSLVHFKNWNSNKKTCLNISAVQMEQTMDILNQKISNGLLHKNIVKNWEKPLLVISGAIWSAHMTSCLGKVSSTYSKKLAKEIFEKLY